MLRLGSGPMGVTAVIDEERASEMPVLRLLGGWRLRYGGCSVPLRSREQRLTALLALRGIRNRTYIAGTLWPESSEHHALLSLRAALCIVHKWAPGLIESQRDLLALAGGLRTDVDELQRCSIRAVATPSSLNHCDALMTLTSPDLLEDWDDDWLLVERERLKKSQLQGLQALAKFAVLKGEPDLAIPAAAAAVELEPLVERNRTQLIATLLAAGSVVDARMEYERYCKVLASELGMKPSRHLTDLVVSAAGRR